MLNYGLGVRWRLDGWWRFAKGMARARLRLRKLDLGQLELEIAGGRVWMFGWACACVGLAGGGRCQVN